MSEARIREERPDPAVARLVLARPEARNAQDLRMLYELDAAYVAGDGRRRGAGRDPGR